MKGSFNGKIFYINHWIVFFRFKLTEVSQVQSNLESDGWFSSKLMTMKLVSGGLSNGGLTLASKENPKFCLSKPTSVTSKKVSQKVNSHDKIFTDYTLYGRFKLKCTRRQKKI